jgi:NADP-dependent 3-hydroxy acid dehydrogenase YdfG
MNLFDLTGKVAVVTGASSGLGADAAKAYAAQGADVALLARRKEKLDAVVKEIEATGGRAIAVACDVSKEENVKSAVRQVLETFGKIDILLNDAGVAQAGSVETLAAEDWDRSIGRKLRQRRNYRKRVGARAV